MQKELEDYFIERVNQRGYKNINYKFDEHSLYVCINGVEYLVKDIIPRFMSLDISFQRIGRNQEYICSYGIGVDGKTKWIVDAIIEELDKNIETSNRLTIFDFIGGIE